MKRLIFFLVLILSFSGCSEFHHMHYRKVKKVQAKGIVEALFETEKDIIDEKKPGWKIDSLKPVESEILIEKQDTTATFEDTKRGYSIPLVPKKQEGKIKPVKKSFSDKLQLKKQVSNRKRADGTVFLIVLFLCLGLGLLILGGTILVTAVYASSLWLVLLGLVVFLLGLLPFLGLLSFAFGRPKHDAPRFDEKK